MSTKESAVSLVDAVREFALTTIVLSVTVVVVSLVFGTGWQAADDQGRIGLLIFAATVAVLLVVPIRSPWGRFAIAVAAPACTACWSGAPCSRTACAVSIRGVADVHHRADHLHRRP